MTYCRKVLMMHDKLPPLPDIKSGGQLRHIGTHISPINSIDVVVALAGSFNGLHSGSLAFQNKFQTLVGIYLTITIAVVGIAQRGVITATSSVENVETVVHGERGIGLQPQCNHSSHNWCSHRRTAIAAPGIRSPVVVEMPDIVCQSHAVIAVIVDIKRTVGRIDVLSRCHHVGFGASILRGTDRRERCAHPIDTLVIFLSLAEIIDKARAISRSAHTDDARCTAW